MIETEIEAAINQLRADTMPFLDVQRQRLLSRHKAVERQSKELHSRRRQAINIQRKLYLDQQNKGAPSVYHHIKNNFELNIWSGINSFKTTMGYVRNDMPTTSRIGIIFSGRHLLGELGRTNAWFFNRPHIEMEKCLQSPECAVDQYLGKKLCGDEHLTFQTIDVEDVVIIPSQANENDFNSGIPAIEISMAEDNAETIDPDLINLADTIAARANAVLNCISVRFAANLNYLKRRERAVEEETLRVSQIEKHFEQAEINWKLEKNIAQEYRRWSECAILVNLGTEQDRLQRGVIEQVLTTTDLLLRVPESALAKMVVKARQHASYEETHKRWGIETISLPISTPKTIWSFRTCLLYLHLEYPKEPTMPTSQIDRKELWKAAARFGILTKAWSNWFYHLEPAEMWELHYGDLTFGESKMEKK